MLKLDYPTPLHPARSLSLVRPARRALMERPCSLESGRGNAVLQPGHEVGAVGIEGRVELQEVRDVVAGCKAVAVIALFGHLEWKAVGMGARSGGRLGGGACGGGGGGGGVGLGWTGRAEWATLWCGEADVVARLEV